MSPVWNVRQWKIRQGKVHSVSVRGKSKVHSVSVRGKSIQCPSGGKYVRGKSIQCPSGESPFSVRQGENTSWESPFSVKVRQGQIRQVKVHSVQRGGSKGRKCRTEATD